MVLLRPKPNRVRYVNNTSTLDNVHRKYLAQFDRQKLDLPQMRRDMSKKQSQLEVLEKKSSSEYTNEDIISRSQLHDDIQSLQSDIDDIENHHTEMEYYDSVCETLVEYYGLVDINADIEENENENVDIPNTEAQQIPSLINEMDELDKANAMYMKKLKIKTTQLPKKRKRQQTQTSSSISDFFITKTETEQSSSTSDDKDDSKKKINRATLNKKYRQLVNKDVTQERPNDAVFVCEDCQVERVLIPHEGLCVCRECGQAEYVMLELEMATNDTMTEKPGYTNGMSRTGDSYLARGWLDCIVTRRN